VEKAVSAAIANGEGHWHIRHEQGVLAQPAAHRHVRGTAARMTAAPA